MTSDCATGDYRSVVKSFSRQVLAGIHGLSFPCSIHRPVCDKFLPYSLLLLRLTTTVPGATDLSERMVKLHHITQRHCLFYDYHITFYSYPIGSNALWQSAKVRLFLQWKKGQLTRHHHHHVVLRPLGSQMSCASCAFTIIIAQSGQRNQDATSYRCDKAQWLRRGPIPFPNIHSSSSMKSRQIFAFFLCLSKPEHHGGATIIRRSLASYTSTERPRSQPVDNDIES